MDLSRIRLVSSNENKLAEFKELGLPLSLERGIDLPEVNGSPDDVIVYKSNLAGPGTIVEDTVLFVDGEPIVDIRWRINQLGSNEGVQAVFQVSLALNDGDQISVWQGRIHGALRLPPSVPDDSFGFDSFFVPEGGSGLDLHQLKLMGRKHDFNARAKAIKSLLSEEPIFIRNVTDIEPWNGEWQKGNTPK